MNIQNIGCNDQYLEGAVNVDINPKVNPDKVVDLEKKLPFYSSWGQYNDPTQVRFMTPFTFDYFKKGNYSHEVEVSRDLFSIEEVKLNFGVGESAKLNFIMNPIINLNHRFYCRFFAWMFPASEIKYKLKVNKQP